MSSRDLSTSMVRAGRVMKTRIPQKSQRITTASSYVTGKRRGCSRRSGRCGLQNMCQVDVIDTQQHILVLK